VQNGPIKAIVNQTELRFEFRDGILTLDGEAVDASLVHVNNNTYSLLLGGRSYELTIQQNGRGTIVTESNVRSDVTILDRAQLLLESYGGAGSRTRHTMEVRAPMPGLVLAIEVEQGAMVQSGQGLIVLEAMKMENEIFASVAGVVEKVHVAAGEAVTKGQILVTLDDA